MIRLKNISISTCILALSLLLLVPLEASAQYGLKKKKREVILPDTTAFFNGIAVSADLLGPAMLWLGDYGSYEAALRVNLKDRWFPVLEVGLGKTDHVDDATQTSYKVSSPYFRLGGDFNLMKNKHDIYRIYAGARYAFTNFKYDLGNPGVKDPVWGNVVPFEAHDAKCYYHWLEVCFGVDAKIIGPFHLGWSVRYKNRLFYDAGPLDNCWYVPGFGKSGKTAFGGTFNVIIDI